MSHFLYLHPENGIIINLLHKYHNEPVPYRTMHHFVTEMCVFLLQNGALWDIYLVHCGICGMVYWLQWCMHVKSDIHSLDSDFMH